MAAVAGVTIPPATADNLPSGPVALAGRSAHRPQLTLEPLDGGGAQSHISPENEEPGIEPSTPPEIAALISCAATTGIGAVVNTAGVRAGRASSSSAWEG